MSSINETTGAAAEVEGDILLQGRDKGKRKLTSSNEFERQKALLTVNI